jgi:hypothetical protein
MRRFPEKFPLIPSSQYLCYTPQQQRLARAVAESIQEAHKAHQNDLSSRIPNNLFDGIVVDSTFNTATGSSLQLRQIEHRLIWTHTVNPSSSSFVAYLKKRIISLALAHQGLLLCIGARISSIASP